MRILRHVLAGLCVATASTVVLAAAPVNVNSANAEALQALNGIGSVTAEAIIEEREANGPFASVEELIRVDGIGDTTMERLRERVTVQ